MPVQSSLQFFEKKHNDAFPNSKISAIYRINNYIYFQTKFGVCRKYIGNFGKAIHTIISAIDKTEYLVNQLQSIHGDKFDYSLVKWDKCVKDKISLICHKHGVFYKEINNVLTCKSSMCPVCNRELLLSGDKQRSNKESFIEKANVIHNFKYDYSMIEYHTAKSKIDIICKEHGIFSQTPCNHLTGYGCQYCKNIKTSERNKEMPTGWRITSWQNKALSSNRFDSFKVYIIECWNDEEKFYKIGRTYNTVSQRFGYKTAMPYNYRIVKIFKGTCKDMFDKETKLKNINKKNKYVPKINFGGMYECFSKQIKLNEKTS